MPHGFNTWKDVLDVVVIPVIIPLVIWCLGARLPGLFEAVKTQKFLALINRELGEMAPEPKTKQCRRKWHQSLTKRFMHEEIFSNVSENRDFILSLPPDVSYNTAQLWISFDKATASWSEKDLAKHGDSWCFHLYKLCSYFDDQGNGDLVSKVYKPWEHLILVYHHDLEKLGRIPLKR